MAVRPHDLTTILFFHHGYVLYVFNAGTPYKTDGDGDVDQDGDWDGGGDWEKNKEDRLLRGGDTIVGGEKYSKN